MTKMEVVMYKCNFCEKVSQPVPKHGPLPDGWTVRTREAGGGGHYEITWTERLHACSACSSKDTGHAE